MKFLKRLSVVAIGAVMMFSITGMNVFASSISRDGLEFSFTTDKEIYAEDEKITATLSVKNTNSTDVTDITMETIIPDGYEVVDESVNIRQIEKLAPSETVELKSVYNSKSINEGSEVSEISEVSEVSEINESSETSEVSSIHEISEISQNDIVNTGDNKSVDNVNKQNEIVDTSDTSSINIIACIVLVCVSSAIIIFSVKRKSGRRVLSLVVCMLLIGNITAIVPIQVNALQTQQKTMTIKENITVNGSPMLLTATVIYKISGDNLFIGDSSEEQVVIYFYKPDGWNDPYINFYSADNSEESAVLADMTEVSDGWYGYIIENCKTAEVAFTDKNNRIPTSDREWIDVSGVMWYKDNKKCNSEEDTDGDGLPDFIELILNSDIDNPDTDGDMIFDGDEVLSLGTDPLNPDTDNDGISDADEDLDTDGLSNMRELLLGTNPLARDSDNDKITDGDEINKYKTDPLKSDTDGDNAEDGWEIKNEYDPLIANSSFNVTLTAEDEENNLNASVTVEVIGSQTESLNAEFLENTFYMNPTIPGYIGKGLELSVNDEVDNAELEFTFDESLLENEDFIPTIYYYNEETQCLEELETTTTDNVSKAHLKHFSTYILLNKTEFEKIWENEIRLPSDDAILRNLKVSFVVDCSGSMWGSVATTQEVLKAFVNILHEDDQVSLVTFETSANVVCDFSSDKSVVSNAINSVYAGGGTAIYAGLSTAENLFDNNDKYDNLIILITDGEDSYYVDYDNTYTPLINNANNNHITIYTIGVGDYIDTNLLNKIAGGTHGNYYHATAISDLQEKIENIQGEIIDYTKDSNHDDISDYYTKKLTSGELRYGTHAYVFGAYDKDGIFSPATYEEVQENNDFDKDELRNSQEIQVDIDPYGHPYIKFQTDPSNEDSDIDNINDDKDIEPLRYNDYACQIKSYINNNIISMNSIKETSDGFMICTTSLADMLNNANILFVRSTNDNYLNVQYYYDDWYIFIINNDSPVFGLYKMREQENDSDYGDGDDPGVAISFVSFDVDLLSDMLFNKNQSNPALNIEIDKVVIPGNPYNETIQTYFSDVQSEGAYLIAEQYVNKIASFMQNNTIQLPNKLNEILDNIETIDMLLSANLDPIYQSFLVVEKNKLSRVPEALKQNNINADQVIYDENNRLIRVNDSNTLNYFEQIAVLSAFTADISFNMFSAEVQAHAEFLTDWKRIFPIWYNAAVIADMAIGEDNESGYFDAYYDPNYYLVVNQRRVHGEK